MDRRYVRELLALSCCANIALCLLIIYHCNYTLPSGVYHSPEISNSPSHNFAFKTKLSPLKSSNITNQNQSKKTFQETVTSKRSEITDDLLYDPAFGIHHYLRKLPPRDVKELFQRVIPNMVFYVWCGKGHIFLYKHFISVYFIWYNLEPDVIEIHYEFPPLEDKYNTWLSWLRSNMPAFSLHPLPSHATGNRCGPRFGLEILGDRGGLFLANGVLLHSASKDELNILLTATRSFSFFQDNTLAWAAASAGDPAIKSLLSLTKQQQHSQKIPDYLGSKSFPYNTKQCTDQAGLDSFKDAELDNRRLHFNNMTQLPQHGDDILFCHRFQKNIHPIDVLKAKNASYIKNTLQVLYKTVIFNQTDDSTIKITRPTAYIESEIPKTVHYIWFGRKNMTFSMYLSFLSSLHLIQPEVIIIHSDHKLYGRYWHLVVTHSKVRVVYREAPMHIYNKRILYTQHRSDIVRADVLNKYGGIYLDWDAFWLKSPEDLLMSQFKSNYDIILSRDHMPRPPFPDTINMGVVLARPRSKFIQAWQAAWLHYRPNNFLYNAVELPYKIYELFPESSFLHDRLQVMCYYLKCHPLFHPDHKHWGKSQPFDWSGDVYVIHFTHPDPPAFQNESALLSGQGMFAEIGRFIWNLRRNVT